ncbi:MAG: hypothetical protein PWP24_1435 [Clostridiales bacterium]|nr:hypothetical protein [Clostridiales bacterium]
MELNLNLPESKTDVLLLLEQLMKVPAPSNKEKKRADFCKNWLEEQGAEGVFVDEAYNVIYPYGCEEGKSCALFMAHLDTVFSEEEPLKIREQDGRLYAPGIGDDTANLAILLVVAKYLAREKPDLAHGIIVSANAGEEGLGNLKGARALLSRYQKRLDFVVSFDVYLGGICNRSVGSLRYEIEINTKGGHSYFDFGEPNAIERMASLIQTLYAYQIPEDGSKTTFNVGEITGGTSVNTIAQSARILYEIRSEKTESLLHAKRYFEEVIQKSKEPDVSICYALLGERPCGQNLELMSEQENLERFARKILKCYFGEQISCYAGSTDANIPHSLGIPAITTGLIMGGGMHTRQEWIDPDYIERGIQICEKLILLYGRGEWRG